MKKGEPPVVGITRLQGVTLEELKRPRREIPLGALPVDATEITTVSASASPVA